MKKGFLVQVPVDGNNSSMYVIRQLGVDAFATGRYTEEDVNNDYRMYVEVEYSMNRSEKLLLRLFLYPSTLLRTKFKAFIRADKFKAIYNCNSKEQK